jgi:hypothetical protein
MNGLNGRNNYKMFLFNNCADLEKAKEIREKIKLLKP